jgi:hypothetical protein
MAKRAGKAASRKARQRKIQRPPAPAAVPAAAVESDAPSPAPVTAPPPARRASAPTGAAPSSQLTATERSEYHYVERDLRDIAILTAAMAALLFVAWLVFSAAGIGG